MSFLLILALLVFSTQASPARLEKRDTHGHDIQCPHEVQGLAQLFEMYSALPWEKLENFSFINTPLSIFGNNTAQTMINYFISEFFQEMENSITENAGAPYETMKMEDEGIYIDKNLTKMANRMMFHEMTKISSRVVRGIDMANMEMHKFMSSPYNMKEMVEGVKMQVFMVQGMAGALMDWEHCHKVLDCYEEFFDSNTDHPLIKFLNSINYDPKMYIQNGKSILSSLQRMLESEDLHKAMEKCMEKCMKMMETLEIDDLFSEVYNALLHFRGHCIQTNWNSVAMGAYMGCNTIRQGRWKVMTGRWPEMVEYLQSFKTEVLQKDAFWQRLDSLFQYGVSQAKEMFIQNKGKLAEMMTKNMEECNMMVGELEKASFDLEPSFMQVCEKMMMFGDHMLVDNLEMLPHHLEWFLSMLPTSKMVCEAKMANSLLGPVLKDMMGGEREYNKGGHNTHDDDYYDGDDYDGDYYDGGYYNGSDYDEYDNGDYDDYDQQGMSPMENFLMTLEDNMPSMQALEMFKSSVNKTLGDLFFRDWPEGMNCPAESMKKTVMDGIWKMNYALVSPYCKHMMFEYADMTSYHAGHVHKDLHHHESESYNN